MAQNPSQSTADKDTDPDFRERRAARVAAGGEASLKPQNLYEVEVKVRNLSPCGFMAECDEAVRIGSYVTLNVPGIGAVHAQVRWQIGTKMGGKFLDPISLARCEWTAVQAPNAEAA